MTAPLFLLEPGRLDAATAGGLLRLDGAEGRHAATVRRLRAGEPVILADGWGRWASGVVDGVSRDAVTVRLGAVGHEPEPQPRLVLVQALAKGERDEQAVETATELGVDEIVPWQAARSIVAWRGERGARSRRKWELVARAAAKQSRRTRVPPVAPLATTADVVRRVQGAALCLVLHEEASWPLAGSSLPGAGDVLVVVGPEGGIEEAELMAFADAGAKPVRLGRTVLRSSSAGPAALAVLSAADRWR